MATLSVIIPVYQSAATLERCLDSVLLQNVPDMEVILVDDGSTDGGSQLCDRLADANPCVKVIHRENGGLSAARNSGIGIASGQWITFVDSDDELIPLTLTDNLRWLEQNPDTDMLEFPVSVHFKSSKEYQLDFIPRTVKGPEIFADWLANGGYNHCYAWNKIFRRSLFDGVRFPEGETFEDAAICPVLVKACNAIRYSNVGRYLYYSNNSGITANYTFKGQEPLFRHNFKLLEESAEMAVPECRTRLWGLCMNLLIDLYRSSEADPVYISEAAHNLASLKPSVSWIMNSGVTLKVRFKMLLAITIGPLAMCRMLGHKKYRS